MREYATGKVIGKSKHNNWGIPLYNYYFLNDIKSKVVLKRFQIDTIQQLQEEWMGKTSSKKREREKNSRKIKTIIEK